MGQLFEDTAPLLSVSTSDSLLTFYTKLLGG